jgi:hypothetical protein
VPSWLSFRHLFQTSHPLPENVELLSVSHSGTILRPGRGAEHHRPRRLCNIKDGERDENRKTPKRGGFPSATGNTCGRKLERLIGPRLTTGPFCREFNVSGAPETRAKRALVFSTLDRIRFVEGFGGMTKFCRVQSRERGEPANRR